MFASAFSFFRYEVPFVRNQLAVNIQSKQKMSNYVRELSQIKKQVDPTKVVSIPAYTVKMWVGYRYSFFPRGVSFAPIGIADYVVYPINGSEYLAAGYDKALPLEALSNTFAVVSRTPHFVLLRRNSMSEEEKASRKVFFNLLK
jgi:hypothetical protein